MKKKREDWIELGVVRSVHGLKGAFDLKLENTQDSSLAAGKCVLLTPLHQKSCLPQEGLEVEIEKIVFGHKVMLYFAEVKDRSESEKWIPFSLSLKREDFEKTEDEYYQVDMMGLKAYEYQTEVLLGRVERVGDNGAQMVLTIGRGIEAFDIPFVEAFVPEVDLEKGKIWVRKPEYI